MRLVSFAKLFTYATLFSALFCPSLRAQAQQDPDAFDKGLLPFVAYGSSSFDSVNPNSGNLMLHIPLFSYPQRGALPNFEIYIRNNSWSWYEKKKCGTTTCDKFVPNTPYGVPVVQYSPSFYIKSYSWKDPFNGQISRAQHAVDQSGAHHILGSIGASLSFTFQSTDGTGIRYNSNGTIVDRMGISFGNGSIRDPNGNAITLPTTSPGTDSVGRSIPNIAPPNGAGCSATNFPGPNGGTVPLTLCYGSHTATSAFCPTYCAGGV